MEHRTSFFNEQSDVSFLCCIFAIIMLNWVSCVLKSGDKYPGHKCNDA